MDCSPSQECLAYACHRRGETWTEIEEEEGEGEGEGSERKGQGKTYKQTPPGGRSYASGGDRRREGRTREGRLSLLHPGRSLVLICIFRSDWNALRGSRMIHTTSLIGRRSRSQRHPLPQTSIRFLSSALMILCLLRQVRPVPPARMSPRYSPIAVPVQAETILREDYQPSIHQRQEFVVDREGEMPTFAKPSTPPISQPALPNPNEFPQSMSSTPVSVASFPIYDVGVDEIHRSRSLDPIKVTRPKKGATGKKKRTAKPEVAAT